MGPKEGVGKSVQTFRCKVNKVNKFFITYCLLVLLLFLSFGLNINITHIWRRKWQSTPVFLPGKSHGWRSLVTKVCITHMVYIFPSYYHLNVHHPDTLLFKWGNEWGGSGHRGQCQLVYIFRTRNWWLYLIWVRLHSWRSLCLTANPHRIEFSSII